MNILRWPPGILAGAVCCATAQPTNLFYDDLDPVTHAEVKTFISMYTHVLTYGEPAPGAEDFTFTRSEANSPLFQPYIAYVRTLAKIKGGGDSQYFGHLVSPADVAAYSSGTVISTSMSEPAPTVNHLSAIVASDDTVQASVTEGTLSSVGLGVQPVESGTPYVSPLDPPEFEAWMGDLASLATNVAGTLDPAMDVKHMLLGQPTNAEQLRASLDSWLSVQRPDDIWIGSHMIHGMFGQFGALPVIIVYYQEGYLLLDGVDGTMVGPFLHDDDVDLLPLLTLRTQYSVGTGAAGVDMVSSTTVVAAVRKHTAPPRGYGLDGTCPGNPGCFVPRNAAGTPFYGCQPMGAHPPRCECKATGTYRPNPGQPPGPPVPTEIICRFPATPAGNCPDNLTVPPALIGAPATCTQTWTYAR